MAKKLLRLTVLILTVCILLTGCDIADLLAEFTDSYFFYVDYQDMEYTRPDPGMLQESADQCIALANDSAPVAEVMDAVYDFYTQYDTFHTNYTLADIRYSADLTNAYWEAEYTFCAESAPTAEAALEQLLHGLALSPLREELEADDYFGQNFFDAYKEEPVIDKTLMAMMEQEAQLESQYYTLSDRYTEAGYTLEDSLFTEMAELLIQLVQLRQEMASYLGYSNYPAMAYDLYYSRDYTPEQAVAYTQQLSAALREPYMALANSSIWEEGWQYCSEEDTYQYLRSATSSMGGIAADAFAFMDTYSLYDIAYGENKLASSFEAYIWNYYAPFVFMNPYLDHSDKLVLAHEFGHFTADYACDGSFAGTDIAEIHSQAMEYLSLCYSKDAQMLTTYKLADSLCTYVEQSAYASFEHQLYDLDPGQLSVETITALYEEVGLQFGFDSTDWDTREYVTVLHFFTEPMYIISYVGSNDLAMQIYQMELAQSGTGLQLYEQIFTSQESYLLTFAQEYGLEDPFSADRLRAVCALFQSTDF